MRILDHLELPVYPGTFVQKKHSSESSEVSFCVAGDYTIHAHGHNLHLDLGLGGGIFP